MRIIVVDDSEEGCEIAEAMLLSAGYNDITIANSADELFGLLAVGSKKDDTSVPVDLLLLDIVMPKIDGIEACARIRSDARYADVPIIMATSLADMDSLANAFIAGATDYINKPLKRVELLARVRSALKLKAELDRRQERERELLQFMSTWGDRRASLWIDPVTDLFVGEVAEAYLNGLPYSPSRNDTVIALVVDRLDAFRKSQGDAATAEILSQIASVVRASVATIGTIAAAYRNGMIVLIVTELEQEEAVELGEALRASIAKLSIANPESIVADHITASVAVITGKANCGIDRVRLLTRAIQVVPGFSAAGGDRVVADTF